MPLLSWIKRGSSPGSDPLRSNSPAAALLRELHSWVASGKVIGGVGLVVREGRTSFLEAFGFRDREKALPAKRDTIFALSSLTKPFTCAAAMALVDDGKISLDDPVHRFVPGFLEPRLWDGSAAANPVLIRHLMTHTSGVIDAIPDSFLTTDFSLAELVEVAAAQPLAFEPGTRWAYSTLGFDVLGRVVEIASGRPLDAFVQSRILHPLDMIDSFFVMPRGSATRVAVPYRTENDRLTREGPQPSPRVRFISASTGLYGTATDLSHFWHMLIGKGMFRQRRILSDRSAQAMVTGQTGSWEAGFFPGFSYGLGCSVIAAPTGMFARYSPGTFGHGGFFQTHAWADPAAHLIAIILCQHRCPQPVSDEVAAFLSRAPDLP